MKFVRLCLLFLIICIPAIVVGQPGQYVVPISAGVVIVNGTDTLPFGMSQGEFYIGYGDSLIFQNQLSADIYVDNGGYLLIDNNGSSNPRIFLASGGVAEAMSGSSTDSVYKDTSCTFIGTGFGPIVTVSPLLFSFSGSLSYSGNFISQAIKNCSGTEIVVHIAAAYVGMSIITDYGDGHIDTTLIQSLQGTVNGYAGMVHHYSSAAQYSIKQVLWDNQEGIDSLAFNYEHAHCSEMPVRFYMDIDGDCAFQYGTDKELTTPLMLQIDSNNITIDTVSVISGANYVAYGDTNAIYKFTLLSFPGDAIPWCPATAYVVDTFVVGTKAPKFIGVKCVNGTDYDLSINIDSRAGYHLFESFVTIQNTYCAPVNATLTMLNNNYSYSSSNLPPASTNVGATTWNLNGLSSTDGQIILHVYSGGGPYATGTPIPSTYTITPTTGDVNPVNNTVIIIDTVEGAWDPNAIYVKPEGCVNAGTELEYTITFENLGNGVAENIYILDTLPLRLDPGSLELEYSSHPMNIQKIYWGQYTIYKYDFPDINLPDSSDHVGRHGGLRYKIRLKNNIPLNTGIAHSAGIYFDYNPVVLTNTVQNFICQPQSVKNVATKTGQAILIYPNPATDELTIEAEHNDASYTITNSMGQVILTGDINARKSKVDIRPLAPGLYYINTRGQARTEVMKFIKL